MFLTAIASSIAVYQRSKHCVVAHENKNKRLIANLLSCYTSRNVESLGEVVGSPGIRRASQL